MIEYIGGVAMGAAIAAIIVTLLAKRDLDRIVASISDSVVEILSKLEPDRVSVAQKKKEAIQKIGPKTFYYIDKGTPNK